MLTNDITSSVLLLQQTNRHAMFQYNTVHSDNVPIQTLQLLIIELSKTCQGALTFISSSSPHWCTQKGHFTGASFECLRRCSFMTVLSGLVEDNYNYVMMGYWLVWHGRQLQLCHFQLKWLSFLWMCFLCASTVTCMTVLLLVNITKTTHYVSMSILCMFCLF